MIDPSGALVRYCLAAVALCLALGAAVQTWRLHSARADLAECVAVRAREAAIAQRMFDAAVGAARESEARWAAEIKETQTHAQTLQDRARRAAADAAAAADGLRRVAHAAAARGCSSPEAATIAAGSPPAGHVLADVLADVAAAGASMAAAADAAGIAGSACERSYDAVSGSAASKSTSGATNIERASASVP